ncbi:MAG: hypothetical protein AAGI48_13410 [Verrucomicrobiota bacterium]
MQPTLVSGEILVSLAHVMKPFNAFLSIFFFAFTLPLVAQDDAQDGSNSDNEEENENVSDELNQRQRFWKATIPGGHYMVALDRISTISMHEFLLSESGVVVNEVTIDTSGRALARFYHIAPITDTQGRDEVARVVDRGRELLDRAGQRAGTDAHNMAQKSYPATTHSGTIEYRVLDLRDLDALYGSLQRAWETGKGRKFTIK